jgi:hypothetical protein
VIGLTALVGALCPLPKVPTLFVPGLEVVDGPVAGCGGLPGN